MNNILQIILLTFFPLLELRGSIPYGILKLHMPWLTVFVVAVLANMLIGIVVYLLMDYLVKIFTKINWIDSIWQKYIEKTQNKYHAAVEKYGEWALAVFIGIPLPMTGAYSGAIAAKLIGLNFKKFFIANFLGVLMAGIIVTIIVLFGQGAFSFFIKQF